MKHKVRVRIYCKNLSKIPENIIDDISDIMYNYKIYCVIIEGIDDKELIENDKE